MAFQMNPLSLASIFPLASFIALLVVCFETTQTLSASGEPSPFEGCCDEH